MCMCVYICICVRIITYYPNYNPIICILHVFPFFLLLEIPRFLYRSFLRQSPPHIDAAQALLQPHGSRLRPEISKPKPHGYLKIGLV